MFKHTFHSKNSYKTTLVAVSSPRILYSAPLLNLNYLILTSVLTWRQCRCHTRCMTPDDVCINGTRIRLHVSHIAASDRQTDRYFIDRNKSHYRLICHSDKRDICTCIYKNVSLLKSYMTIYMVWQTTKIMLGGIAIIKTGYFGNINDYFLQKN